MNATDTPAREIIIPDEPVAPDGAWLSTGRWLYPQGAPLVTSVPDNDSPEAYNEDEIVSLWNQIYYIFLKIRYLKEADVVFPPADIGRHTGIDKGRLRDEFNMSERVISLLERLPYLAKGAGGWDGTPFFPFGLILNYLNVKEMVLRECRQPILMFTTPEEPREDYLLPDDVALLTPYEADGLVWILDTKANTIRTLAGIVEYQCRTIPDDFEDERPDHEDNYRNWPAFHAPFVLKRYIRDLWSLRFIPLDGGNTILESNTGIAGALIARKLKEDYGWPDDFRANAWEQDAARTLEAADDMARELAGHPSGLCDEIIADWQRNPEHIPYLVVPHGPTLR